jgi:hypothetical protein
MLDEHVEITSGQISAGTMHLAKGLEFRTVVVMACDDEIIPLQSRIETVTDDNDLEEIYIETPGWSATLRATWKAAETDCLERRNSIRPCVPSHAATWKAVGTDCLTTRH